MERTTEGFTSQGGGGGQVHSHMSNHPADADQSIAGMARDQAEEMADNARERVGALRDRAGEMASEARDRAGRALHDAEDALEERTGALSAIRNNALPAMGIAFALGFALAGSSANKSGISGFARRRVRTALRASIAAALTQELRNMAMGSDGLLGTLFGESTATTGGRNRSTSSGRGSAGTTAGMRGNAGESSAASTI